MNYDNFYERVADALMCINGTEDHVGPFILVEALSACLSHMIVAEKLNDNQKKILIHKYVEVLHGSIEKKVQAGFTLRVTKNEVNQ